ncbi:MBL fold metallo-hydrolase [Pseudofulvibacter geojedonensis]|uniref:MBL fold metallo-hydrolase n=1 Tax=Pseudofulvibacter geojedonensis TaxID=1123758 RepID=A0ABW3I044_9FLAO
MAKLYNVGSFDNPVYLIGEKGNWTLIEGGISAQYLMVKNRLSAIVDNVNDIKHWIILHTHYDHCGLLGYLYPNLPEVQVYAGEKSCINLSKDKSIQVIESLNSNVITLKDNKKELEGLKTIALKEIPIRTLKANEKIKCAADLIFNVIPTPGHSDCSIALFEEYSGRLFASDALGEYFSPKEWFPLAFSSISDYLNSIDLLKSTEPKTIALGHSECLSGIIAKEAFHYSTESTHRIIEDVQQNLKKLEKEAVVQLLHQKYAYNSQEFVPENLHYLSMKRLVDFITNY